MVNVSRTAWQLDGLSRADDTGRGLDEDQRLRRERLVLFRRVILVIQPDADDLRWHDWRQQPVGRGWDAAGEAELPEDIPFDKAPLAVLSVVHGVPWLAFMVDAEKSSHLAVSSALLDCALTFGGV